LTLQPPSAVAVAGHLEVPVQGAGCEEQRCEPVAGIGCVEDIWIPGIPVEAILPSSKLTVGP